jgi:hypothetical protein
VISSLAAASGKNSVKPPILRVSKIDPILNKLVPSVKKGLFSSSICSKGSRFK